jgi:hypothetical protein
VHSRLCSAYKTQDGRAFFFKEEYDCSKMSASKPSKTDIRGFFGSKSESKDTRPNKSVALDSSDMVIVDSDSENDKGSNMDSKTQGR